MPRKIRLATVCQRGQFRPDFRQTCDHFATLLTAVWPQRPDIVCLPEIFATAGQSGRAETYAQSVPGPITDTFAALAREHRCYIVCPLLTRQDEDVFNSAVILDRNGDVVGIYDKAHPVTSSSDYREIEHGVTPGPEDVPTFELDFGRIGIQICFDIEFPETWAALAKQGAELVFWPSAYDGGEPLAAYAQMHNYYVASAVWSNHSRLVNPLGEELEQTGRTSWLCREIDLDFLVVHNDFHAGLIDELARQYGRDVTTRQVPESGKILIETNAPDLPLATIAERFGLVSRREYISRHREAYEFLRRGEPSPPQSPAFLGRPPYQAVSLAEWERLRAGS
jgi:predicted amidohydrolase